MFRLSILPIFALAIGVQLSIAETDQGSDFSARQAMTLLADHGKLEDWEVVGMTGFSGEAGISRWLVLVERQGRYLEWIVNEEGPAGSRSLIPTPGEEWPTQAISFSRIEIDSSELRSRLGKTLGKGEFARVVDYHAQLRVLEPGQDPVWMLRLLGKGRTSLGTIQLSAWSGKILRTNGLVRDEDRPISTAAES